MSIAARALLLIALWPKTGETQRVARLGDRQVMVWEPAASAKGRRPLVIFSHGFGGCAGQSTFLTGKLAEAGYWVVAPEHRDARCTPGRAGGVARRPQSPFRKPDQWSAATYADRAEDVRAIVGALADSAQLSSRLDVTRLALAGHSLGGYTALGLAGGWPGQPWEMPNVRAVLALSPYSDPYLVHERLPSLRVPVMYQSGTRDVGINTSLKRASGVYDNTPVPKYYVEFDRARHMAWTDRTATYHSEIVAYAVAFLDHHVLGRPVTPALTTPSPRVASLRFKQ